MTGPLRVVGHLGIVLITRVQQPALLVVDLVNLALLLRLLVVHLQLVDLEVLLLRHQLQVEPLRLVDVLLLLLLELVSLLLQLPVTQNNVVELLELVLVGFADFIHEPLIDAHLVDLGVDLIGLELVLLQFEGSLLDFTVQVGDFDVLRFLELDILLLSVLLDLKVI